MIPGRRQLNRAAELLRGEAADPDVLAEAAVEAWSAMSHLPEWPTGLRMAAVELQGLLFADGSIRMTVRESSAEERSRLRSELMTFLDLAEETAGGEPARRDVSTDQTLTASGGHAANVGADPSLGPLAAG